LAGIGEALRSTRERRGLSIDQVAQDTRISPRFLEALEAEQFNELPAPVYVRGFLRSYANYLQIEAQPLLDRLIGGDMATPGAGYATGNGRNGHTNGNGKSQSKRTDPFQRGGVMAATPPVARRTQQPPASLPHESDAWAPEAPVPFTAPHVDHGYIPGSDLMEAPEYVEEYEPEAEPVFPRRRTAGVLAERPPLTGEPGIPRRVLVFGGAVIGILAFLALAVLVTRDGGDGGNRANAGTGDNPGVTPGTIIPVGGAASTATANAATASKTASVTASASASASASATANGTTTPAATQTPGAGTPTSTPTSAPTTQATATPVPPTATPTQIPPTPTPVPAPPHPNTYRACDITKDADQCGSSNVRVICFPPFGNEDPSGTNSNWFADVTGSYPLQPGWREVTVYAPTSIGPVIKAGQYGCQ
jgi:cytoskeleton protein RodZ